MASNQAVNENPCTQTAKEDYDPCEDMSPRSDDGDWMNQDCAKDIISRYKRSKFTLDPDKFVLGHLFHLNCIKSFITAIDTYNEQYSDTDPERITGVRVYRGRHKRRRLGSKKDLIFMPVRANGEDLHHVYGPIPYKGLDYIIMSYSRPCPNLCENELYMPLDDSEY